MATWSAERDGTLELLTGMDMHFPEISMTPTHLFLRVMSYSGNYQYNGNSYLAVYGWTRNPLIGMFVHPTDNICHLTLT